MNDDEESARAQLIAEIVTVLQQYPGQYVQYPVAIWAAGYRFDTAELMRLAGAVPHPRLGNYWRLKED